MLCKVGSYQDTEGALSCKMCEPGYAQDGKGSHTCEKCDEGQYTDKYGAKSCMTCAAGKYSSEEASAVCESCPSGSSSGAGAAGCGSVLPADMLTLVTLTTVISALRVNSAAQELPLVLLVLLGTVVPLVAVLL